MSIRSLLLLLLSLLLSIRSFALESFSPTDQRLAASIHYSQDTENFVGYIDIGQHRMIDESLYLYVKFALEYYRQRGARFIILHLDTPGGEIYPALKISTLLQESDTKHHMPVIAMIHDWALSTAAMLAYSCRFIGINDDSLMGAAQPGMISTQGEMISRSERENPALSKEFGSLAEFFGRNPLVAEAMVDKNLILVQRKGKIISLASSVEIQPQDQLITTPGRFLTLNADQLLALKVADFKVSITATYDVTQAEKNLGEWPASQSHLFTYPFFEQIPNATLIYYKNWKINFFSFFTHPLIASFLLMGVIIGSYLEMNHPRSGLPGIISLLCLALIFFSHFFLETINWFEFFLVSIGTIFLLAEMFFLPGFGFAGIFGLFLVLIALISMLLPHYEGIHFSWHLQDFSFAAWDLTYRLTFYLSALLLSLIIIIFLSRSSRLKKRPSLKQAEETKQLPSREAEGVAFTSLQPGGKVLIDNHLYDALTEKDSIRQGEKVVVVNISGNTLIVSKKDLKNH